MRDLHYFLEIEVIQILEGILISQRHYVLNMLFKLGRSEEGKERDEVRKADSNDEFNFGPTEEAGLPNQDEEAIDVWTDGRRLANQRIARCRGRP